MDSLSAAADGIPTSGPTLGTVSFGGKEGLGARGSASTAGGTGTPGTTYGDDTGGGFADMERGVAGTGQQDSVPADTEDGGGINQGPDVGPDLIEGEAGSAPAGGAEIGEGEMPQGVHPGVVDIQGEEGDEAGVANTMGEER